jgi:hypothetical protein
MALDLYDDVRETLDPADGEVQTAELVVTDDVLVKAFALGPGAELEPHEHAESTNVFHVLEGSVVVARDGESEAVDAMIDALLAAENRRNFVSSVRALDRVLLSGRYVVPLFHLPKQWVAHWTRLRHPETTSLYGYRVDTWWVDPSAADAETN